MIMLDDAIPHREEPLDQGQPDGDQNREAYHVRYHADLDHVLHLDVPRAVGDRHRRRSAWQGAWDGRRDSRADYGRDGVDPRRDGEGQRQRAGHRGGSRVRRRVAQQEPYEGAGAEDHELVRRVAHEALEDDAHPVAEAAPHQAEAEGYATTD